MSIVKKYLSEVISVSSLAENIYSVELKSLQRSYKFQPGQFLHLALDEYDPSDAWPESRCFSMQTNQNQKTLKITYSVKGLFTKQMSEKLRPGFKVWLKLPYGDLFVQEHNKQNTVFIAGGTGLTPFLSLFTDPSFSEYNHPKLYAGFRSGAFDIYNSELTIAGQLSPNLSIRKFFQDKDGLIDIETIYNENKSDSTFFLSGPPLMINNFSKFLKQKGISGNQILTDNWE